MRHENRDNVHVLGTFLNQVCDKTLSNPEILVVQICEITFSHDRLLEGVQLVPHYSIAFLQALVASASICLVPTTPLVDSSSKASTTASPTVSALSGFSAMAPRNPSLFPRNVFTSDVRKPPKAIGRVNFRLESNMNPGLIKMLRSSGRVEVIVSSASLLVVMYLAGRTGAPAAAEMYTKAGTCSVEDSWASAIAVLQMIVSSHESN